MLQIIIIFFFYKNTSHFTFLKLVEENKDNVGESSPMSSVSVPGLIFINKCM